MLEFCDNILVGLRLNCVELGFLLWYGHSIACYTLGLSTSIPTGTNDARVPLLAALLSSLLVYWCLTGFACDLFVGWVLSPLSGYLFLPVGAPDVCCSDHVDFVLILTLPIVCDVCLCNWVFDMRLEDLELVGPKLNDKESETVKMRFRPKLNHTGLRLNKLLLGQ
jgi:hypothetical protein